MRKTKKVSLFTVLLGMFVLSAFSVAAADVAYIVKDTNKVVPEIQSILTSMNYSVNIYTESDLPSADFSSYEFIVVNDDPFSNEHLIPVNEINALVLNTYHLDQWDWSRSSGTFTSTGVLRVRKQNHFIMEPFGTFTSVYNQAGRTYYFLPKSLKAVDLITAASLQNDNVDAVIATIEKGGRLREGETANAKGVFYGITETDYWTADAAELFRRSIIWLTTDFIPPAISNVQVSALTNQSATLTWETDKPGNTTFSYGIVGNEQVQHNADFLENHEVNLSNLEQLTTYQYTITTCNTDGYCASGAGSFTTLDLTPPTILSISPINITNNSIVMQAQVNEESNFTLTYGLSQNLMDNEVSSNSFNIVQGLNLENLEEYTNYHIQVQACDLSGNCAISNVEVVRTDDYTPPLPPVNLKAEVRNNDQAIILSWDAPAGEIVETYTVYIYDNNHPEQNLNNFVTLASTSLTEYVDSNPSSTRYYIVRAQDESGNEEQNNVTIGKQDIELAVGYNLVSFTLQPFDNSIDQVLHQDTSYHPISQISTFDADSQTQKSATYDENTGIWSGEVSSLDPLQGFFMNSDQAVSFTIVGTPLQTKTVQIKTGMNLVGLTLYDSESLSFFNNNPSQFSIEEVSKRKPSGIYEVASYYPSIDGWITNFNLDPLQAYWVKSNQDTTIQVN